MTRNRLAILIALALAAAGLAYSVAEAPAAGAWCDEVDHITCPPPSSTTTTRPTSTTSSSTTSSTTTSSTSSTLPPPQVQCLGQPAHDRTTGPEPCTPPETMHPARPTFTG